MRTHLEFYSRSFAEVEVAAKPDFDPKGKEVAKLLCSQLPNQGFEVITTKETDWGWVIEIQNESFPLSVNCCLAFDPNWIDSPHKFLCYIRPSKPQVFRWLRRIYTAPKVAELATAIEIILTKSKKAKALRWLSEAEA